MSRNPNIIVHTDQGDSSFDSLDGEKLCRGELIEIVFPDGHIVETKVIIKTETTTHRNVDGPFFIGIHQYAFADLDVYGKNIEIDLSRGFKICRKDS